MPVVRVEGIVDATLVSLLPVGRTGAIRVVVPAVVGIAVVEAGEEDEVVEMVQSEAPHSAPFRQQPPPRDAAQLCQFVKQLVTVTIGRVVVTVDVPAMDMPKCTLVLM